MVEVDRHLGNTEVPSNNQRPNQIVPSVTASLEGGNLRAGDDDGFAEVLQHEGERGGGIGESVRSVEDHEPANIERMECFKLQSGGHPTHQNCGS